MRRILRIANSVRATSNVVNTIVDKIDLLIDARLAAVTSASGTLRPALSIQTINKFSA